MNIQSNGISFEHRLIAGLVKPQATVLDLGCGDGELLSYLTKKKQVEGQGIEIDEQAIYKCVARGLSVFHGDLDSGLKDWGDKAFDYVILDQSLQQVIHPDTVLQEALRLGKEVIVGFPNFVQLKARWQLALRGHVPVTPALPFEWFNTPNLHFLSLLDFENYCTKRGISVREKIFISGNRTIKFLPNLRAETGIFLIKKD
ncbi:MAG: methionine biosynthesis protein MetW [bacterium]|nr:methionine biosynthesis protein MetW [bacterium]MDD5354310.1 methionine biosynthesis protein MetW [bacterium]MDD5756658.1 methionine biosynthesis protein MetW [bacterium]